MGISIPQLLIILVIVLLLFGTKKLKGLGSDLGGAIKGFKKAMSDDDEKKSQDGDTDYIEGEVKRESTESAQDANAGSRQP